MTSLYTLSRVAMRTIYLLSAAGMLLSGTVGCGRSLEVRHEFIPLEVKVDDSTVVAVFAHGSWTYVRTADSVYSLRGSPFTLEIQLKETAERIDGAVAVLHDSTGAEVAMIHDWRLVPPARDTDYSIAVADSVALPYEPISIMVTLSIVRTDNSTRTVKFAASLTHHSRTVRPFKLLQVLRGV